MFRGLGLGLYLGSLPHSQAACTDLVRVAEAARLDSCQCDAVASAACIGKKDAEKATHKVLVRFGLSLRVKISWVDLELKGEPLRVPFIKPSDYLKKMLTSYPDAIWGDGVQDVRQRCKSFWKGYYWSHPTHTAFSSFSDNGLGQLIPIQLHGDEGTGSKKQPVSICSWQSVWGKETEGTKHVKAQKFGACSSCREGSCISKCCAVPEKCPKGKASTMRLDAEDLLELQKQLPTSSGHSFLQRHLMCVLPTYLVKKGPEVLEAVLSATAQDLQNLFMSGIEAGGKLYCCALVSLKGDAKWHASTGRFDRCYTRLGDVTSRPICPECLGGDPSMPFEDCSSNPKWVETLYETVPWSPSRPGVQEQIPYDATCPARKYKRDLLHVFKIGLARDITGSGIVFLCRRLKWFDEAGDSVALHNRLKRAHSRFALWAAAMHHSPNLRNFTKDGLHLARVDSFPFTNYKGSDSTLILQWLRTELRLVQRQDQEAHKEDMSLVTALDQVCDSGLQIFRILYRHGLWLPRKCMRTLRDHILRVTRGYNFLALQCLKRSFPGFGLKSTIHSLQHFAIDLDIALQNGSPCFPNFLIQDCSQDEDFIGRTARVARSTHAKTTSLRCLQRHLVKKKMLLKNNRVRCD